LAVKLRSRFSISSNIKRKYLECYKLYNLINFDQYPATFFIEPEIAVKNKGLVRSIKGKGEIGVISDIGFLESPFDTLNKLDSKNEQYRTLGVAKDSLSKITGRQIKAVMPLYGFYDDNTMQAMAEKDYDFLITDSLTDRSVPEIRIRNNKPIMIITKTARDDYEVIRNYGLTNTDFQRYTYEEDVDRILFEGGLYVFKVHSELQLQSQYASVVRDVLRYARNKNIWITSLDGLKAWWNKRQDVEVRYESRSPRRIAVELNNPSDKVTEDIVVQINLNKKIKNISVSSDILNTQIPRYELKNDSQTLYFYLDRMEPHETRSLLVDFENIDS
jgi:hypothetical protein